ncbi:MAG: anhydro-N-acetylmuramic acid kinase, partial [Bacteroidota bacterium]
IVEALQDRFGDVPVRRIEEFGISSEAKEAICFALLANETMAGNAANLPGVTGAKRKVVLGKICPASE